jgi:hypothetical protein
MNNGNHNENRRFMRLTRVTGEVFDRMLIVLEEAQLEKRKKIGRRRKLTLKKQLLMTLEYLREYRIYFHIGNSYGISESSAYKCIKWVENTLIKHPVFHLP